jgi:hypothetical protein
VGVGRERLRRDYGVASMCDIGDAGLRGTVEQEIEQRRTHSGREIPVLRGALPA